MTDTPDVQPPKIGSPCGRYPIKVIDDTGEGFSDLAMKIIQHHTSDFDVKALIVRDSNEGRLLSVQVLIVITDVGQLQATYNDLRTTGRVHMVF